jgi:LacI family transcriptional regulator
LGLRIPQDVSVIGYADFPFGQDMIPPLTTVKQDPYQIGRVAAQILLDRIFDRAKADEPKRIHIKPELIVRSSTGPAPKL